MGKWEEGGEAWASLKKVGPASQSFAALQCCAPQTP